MHHTNLLGASPSALRRRSPQLAAVAGWMRARFAITRADTRAHAAWWSHLAAVAPMAARAPHERAG